MVHRALYGSIERFFGVLIEHYAGAFPVWLSPVQVVVIPIAERHVEYANKVAAMLRGDTVDAGTGNVGTGALARPAERSSASHISVRVEVDARNEKMNAKIREHAMQKVPFMLVVGDKEVEEGKVSVRLRGGSGSGNPIPTAEFRDFITRIIREKVADPYKGMESGVGPGSHPSSEESV
jgi:threonyl-tRNA synthetase